MNRTKSVHWGGSFKCIRLTTKYIKPTFMSPYVLLKICPVPCEETITVWAFGGSFPDHSFHMHTYSQHFRDVVQWHICTATAHSLLYGSSGTFESYLFLPGWLLFIWALTLSSGTDSWHTGHIKLLFTYIWDRNKIWRRSNFPYISRISRLLTLTMSEWVLRWAWSLYLSGVQYWHPSEGHFSRMSECLWMTCLFRQFLVMEE